MAAASHGILSQPRPIMQPAVLAPSMPRAADPINDDTPVYPTSTRFTHLATAMFGRLCCLCTHQNTINISARRLEKLFNSKSRGLELRTLLSYGVWEWVGGDWRKEVELGGVSRWRSGEEGGGRGDVKDQAGGNVVRREELIDLCRLTYFSFTSTSLATITPRTGGKRMEQEHFFFGKKSRIFSPQ